MQYVIAKILYFYIINRFYLQLKPGGLIRVHTSALQPSSQYKSLVISEETTSDELLTLLLSSYNSNEPVEQFSLYEVSEYASCKLILYYTSQKHSLS